MAGPGSSGDAADGGEPAPAQAAPAPPASHPRNLTREEQEVLERVPAGPLREIVLAFWRIKLRLQWKGWLQYVPSGLVALILAIVAAPFLLLGVPLVGTVFLVLAGLAALNFLFEVVTIKLRIRFPERRPPRNDDLDLFDLMRARRSCRSFQTRKLLDEDREELLASVATHLAEPKIGTSAIRFEYASAHLNVWPTVNASEFLIAIAPKAYDRLAVMDVGHSLQQVVMDATRMGLGTCWIGPGADHDSIVAHLRDRFDPEVDHIICVCAVGYRSRYLPTFIRIFNARFSHRRKPLSSLFFEDTAMTEPLPTDEAPFDRFGRTYEICQWAPSSYNAQTTRVVAVRNDDGSLVGFDFYTAISSRYYAPVALGIWLANWQLGCEALGIAGRWNVPLQKAGDGPPSVPRYEASWVLDEAM